MSVPLSKWIMLSLQDTNFFAILTTYEKCCFKPFFQSLNIYKHKKNPPLLRNLISQIILVHECLESVSLQKNFKKSKPVFDKKVIIF